MASFSKPILGRIKAKDNNERLATLLRGSTLEFYVVGNLTVSTVIREDRLKGDVLIMRIVGHSITGSPQRVPAARLRTVLFPEYQSVT